MKLFAKIIVVIIALILPISIIYLWSEHDYELEELDEITTDKEFEGVTYNVEKDIWDNSVLGIIKIDKINLTATVKEGSGESTLSEYIGHIEDTAIYDGNIGLAAHNRWNKYSYFARINELEKGDIVTYKTKFYTRDYVVDNIQVIFDTDWSLLEDTKENKITMITCIANKENQRLCVQATELK